MSRTIERTNVGGLEIELMTLGGGRPLVFLHSGEGPDYGSPFLDALARSFNVFAPSLPGFGHSSLPDDVKRVDDVAYCMLDLFRAHGLKEIALVGVSFGAWAAAVGCSLPIRTASSFMCATKPRWTVTAVSCWTAFYEPKL